MIVTKLLNKIICISFYSETKLHVFNYFPNNILILIFIQKIIYNCTTLFMITIIILFKRKLHNN